MTFFKLFLSVNGLLSARYGAMWCVKERYAIFSRLCMCGKCCTFAVEIINKGINSIKYQAYEKRVLADSVWLK